MPPPKSIDITVIGYQTVGESIILECNVTMQSSITRRINITWISNGVVLRTVEGTNVSFRFNYIQVYTDYYDILQVSTSDDSRVFQCKASVSANPPVSSIGNITLDVKGKLFVIKSEHIRI